MIVCETGWLPRFGLLPISPFTLATQENAKTLLKELVTVTRSEAGCIRYELLQSSVVSNEFALIEEWESEEAFNTHLDSPSVEEALLESRDILASPPDIRRYVLVM